MQSDDDKSSVGTTSRPTRTTTGGDNKEHAKETLSNVALFLGEVRDGLTMVCPNV